VVRHAVRQECHCNTNIQILAMVSLGTYSAYFTLRISNYEIYMQERLSPLNVQNGKSIYTAASND